MKVCSFFGEMIESLNVYYHDKKIIKTTVKYA